MRPQHRISFRIIFSSFSISSIQRIPQKAKSFVITIVFISFSTWPEPRLGESGNDIEEVVTDDDYRDNE